jgi:hypothetical protein
VKQIGLSDNTLKFDFEKFFVLGTKLKELGISCLST